MTCVRWLHISDLHLSSDRPYGQDIVTNSFLDSLPGLVQRHGSVDAIFVSGDIANIGALDEYDQATSFFDRLLEITALPKERLFVAPGNHDVDRKAGKGLARTLFSEQESAAYFEPSAELPHLAARKFHFLNWHDIYFPESGPFPVIDHVPPR